MVPGRMNLGMNKNNLLTEKQKAVLVREGGYGRLKVKLGTERQKKSLNG